MRCYKCGSVLSETDFCNGCGADVTIYKKIIRTSNTYYNMGLEKARVRDLSGAADILRRSVRMDKNNIQARNLLGLVYYEMGEVVEALSQWVISKNIQPDKNLADDYLREVQSNPSRLEAMNMTIRKYNKALQYALDGSDDLAIIQLKKVVNLNPRYVKAYQLLALLYMKKGENGKAKRYLNKSLEIDFNNTLSTKYLKEIEKMALASGNKKPDDENKETKELSGNDVIIPQTGYKDVNYGLMQFITVVVGIVIGAALVYFLITPAKEQRATSEYKETINEYSEKISNLNASLTELKKTNDTLQAEKESMSAELDEVNRQEEIVAAYDKIMEAAAAYTNEDLKGCAAKLLEITDVESQGESFKALYEALKVSSFNQFYNTYYNDAYRAENESRYQDAADAFMMCEKVQPENQEIIYHIAKNLVAANNGVASDQAKEYFKKVIDINPNTDFAGWSKMYVQ